MDHTYNDYINAILEEKKTFTEWKEKHDWNFNEREHQLAEHYEWMIVNITGMGRIVRYDSEIKHLSVVHINNTETERFLDLYNRL